MAFTIKVIRGLLELEDRWTSKLTDAANKTTSFTANMEKKLDNVGRKMTAGGATLTAAFTAPIAGLAAISLKSSNEFEGVMNRVEAMVSDSTLPGNMEKMRAAAQKWGQETVFSSKEAAEAMVELGKAGFDSDKAIAALPATLQLAISGQLELAEAATLSANTMATFGLSAQEMGKANDILAKAAGESTIDVRDLAETFKYVGPLAKAAGISLSEVTAASALLGTAGIKASQAGTTLRGAIGNLMNPTKKQAEAMQRLGLDSAFSGDKLISLTEIIQRITEHGGNAADMMQLFGKYAGPGMIALVSQGAPALDEMNQKLQASDGYAQKVADTFMKGLPGAMEQMKGSVETAGIALGTILLPAAIAVANAVRKTADFVITYVVPAFTALPTPVQAAAGIFLAFVAAIGPLIVGLGLVATGISTLLPLLPILGTVIAAVTGPIGLVVVAIAGLTAAWIAWGDDVTGVVTNTYNSVKEWLVDKWEGSIFQSVARLLESMAKLWFALHVKVLEAVMKVASSVTMWLVDKLKPVVDFLKPFFDAVVVAWKVASGIVTTVVIGMYNAVKTYLVDKFSAIVDAIKGKIDAVTGFFNNMYDKVVGQSYVPDMVNEIGEWFGKLEGNMVSPAQAAIQSTSQLFYGFASDISKMFGAGNQTSATIGSFASGLVGSLGGGMQGLKGFLVSEGTSIAKDFTSTLLSFIPVVGPALSKLGGPIVDGVKKIFGGIFGGADGRGMVEDFVKKSYGSFNNLQQRLVALGDEGEKLWIQLTQKVGRNDKTAAAAAIEAVQQALARSMDATTTAVDEAHDEIATETEDLYGSIREVFAKPFKIPYYFEAQNRPGEPSSGGTASTTVPSGAGAAISGGSGRPINVTMKMDGRTVARASLPYLSDEVELSTA